MLYYIFGAQNRDFCILFFMERYIAILDSGLGGVSVLKDCLKLHGQYNYIYATDSLSLPLGNKSKKYILLSTTKLIDRLLQKYDISVIVLACNTMTTTIIEQLRKRYPFIDFVGTEPCIKLVKDKGYNKALVISTVATLKNSKVIKKYKTKEDVLIADKHLARSIEDNRHNLYRLAPYIATKYGKHRGIVDCVVLGCTHYVFVRELFEKLVCNNVFDSGVYVAKRVMTLAFRRNMQGEGKLIFCDSGDNKKIFEYFNKIALSTTSKYDIL